MLQTDWLKVGTAGKTIDGREIKAEWLEKMAALYSPRTYTATVNSEHFFYPGLGYVTALRTGKDELGRVALYARVAPTSELLARYQNKRQLFFSMEIRSDFPAKGDLYLTGLAITDVPASQGLEPTRYDAGEGTRERFFDTASLEDGDEESGTESQSPPGWWTALWSALRPHFGKNDLTEEQETMSKQEREAFEALEQEVTALKGQVAEIAAKFAAESETEPDDKPDPAAELALSTVEGAIERFAGEVEEKIANAIQPLVDRIERLEAQPAMSERGEVTGPVNGGEQFVF